MSCFSRRVCGGKNFFKKIFAKKEDSGNFRGIYRYHGNSGRTGGAAMPFPQSFLDELIARNDIVDVVGSYVSLTPKGGSFWGCCPATAKWRGSQENCT